ncbi:MAG: type II secretion system F family protein [Chloroflexi bacterium]|nr:type II secretion system F family protein [Chloroflexota bacterium]
MNWNLFSLSPDFPVSILFALLVGLAASCVWLAIAPPGTLRRERRRLDAYVRRPDEAPPDESDGPFARRVLLPLLRRVLRLFGRLMPNRRMADTQRLLIQAGEPGRLTVLDYYGIQLLSTLLCAGLGLLLIDQRGISLRNLVFAGTLVALGLYLPHFWLRQRADARNKEILRALPNALDMLTIGVEAGLAFESAMMRVAERWDNALTREFRHVVLEMRVGTPRDVALQHMAERTDVPDLNTFVAVLVQSSQLGVSVADVLHNQAALMREKRQQRAEAVARQAPVKMAFPLVFFIFPALMVVVLGPAIPRIMAMFQSMAGD